MNSVTIALLLVSIGLSTAAQILLKVGMTSVRAAAASPSVAMFLLQTVLSPWVIAGLTAYFASAVVWLLVLSKVDVSRAYPCVALGFALTVVAAHFLLGEPVSQARILGVAVIVTGVVIVAVT